MYFTQTMCSIKIIVFICFPFEEVVSSLWNCGNSTFAQDHIKSTYIDAATDIRNYFLTGPGKGSAFEELATIADRFGPRIVGSKNLENAIDYIIDQYKSEFKIHTSSFHTYKWVRGREYASLISPVTRNFTIVGLGGTVPTPPCGITAEVVVVQSFEELQALGNRVRGQIVVFNQPWINYFEAVDYRDKGASEAAKHGAVAAMIKSVTPLSINSPHTGAMTYREGVKKIPVASITVEDAEMLMRLQMRTETCQYCQEATRINLHIESSITDTNVTMRNVVIEYPGMSGSNEVILIGAHIDSWDLGTGAMDDLSGVAINLATLRVLKSLGLRPRRTIRVVLWNAEEQGYIGSGAYYKENKDNPNISHVFVLSCDAGAFKPLGLNFTAENETSYATMHSVIKLLEPIDAASLPQANFIGDGGQFVTHKGIPGGFLHNSKFDDYYFQFHHSKGDRATVYQNPGYNNHLDYSCILWATIGYVIGDLNSDECGASDLIQRNVSSA